MHPAPRAWSDTGGPLETSCEMALIGKAAFERDFG
jgi:hypothetical protein